MNKQIKIQIALIIGIITALIYGYASFFLAGSIVFTICFFAAALAGYYLLRHFRSIYYPKGRRI
jgi:hypothetical protein